MDIYSFFSVLISNSLQIRAVFLLFWRTMAGRLYIWKLIYLLCTKVAGILDIRDTFFLYRKWKSYVNCFAEKSRRFMQKMDTGREFFLYVQTLAAPPPWHTDAKVAQK